MTGHSGTIPEAARSELRVYMNIRHCEYMEKGYTIPWLIESSIRHGNFIHLHNLLEQLVSIRSCYQTPHYTSVTLCHLLLVFINQPLCLLL